MKALISKNIIIKECFCSFNILSNKRFYCCKRLFSNIKLENENKNKICWNKQTNHNQLVINSSKSYSTVNNNNVYKSSNTNSYQNIKIINKRFSTFKAKKKLQSSTKLPLNNIKSNHSKEKNDIDDYNRIKLNRNYNYYEENNLKLIYEYSNYETKIKNAFRSNMIFTYTSSILLLLEISNPVSYTFNHSIFLALSTVFGLGFVTVFGKISNKTVQNIYYDSISNTVKFNFLSYHMKSQSLITNADEICELTKSNIEGFYFFKLKSKNDEKFYININKNDIANNEHIIEFLFSNIADINEKI